MAVLGQHLFEELVAMCRISQDRNPTLLLGHVGITALHLSSVQHHTDEREAAIQGIVNAYGLKRWESDELLTGRAGWLQAAVAAGCYSNSLGRSVMKQAVEDILSSGIARAKSDGCLPPLTWEWHKKIYLGAAHGAMGV